MTFSNLLKARRGEACCICDTDALPPSQVPADLAALHVQTFLFLLPSPDGGVETRRLPDKGCWQRDIKLLAAMAARHSLPHSHEKLGPLEVFIAGRVMNWLNHPPGSWRFSPHQALRKGRFCQAHPIKLNSGTADEIEGSVIWRRSARRC